MSTQHTPGTWSVAEESFDNDGIQESVIRGLDGRAAIAVTLDFGPNNPGMREANARRIVACVNALEGLNDDALAGGWSFKGIEFYAKSLEQQRDELLLALEQFIDPEGNPPEETGEWREVLRVIAKVKGGAA